VNGPLPDFRLDGRTAIVTGAGPGIGLHVARAFAASGADVVLCARNAERVRDMERAVLDTGGKAVGVVADVAEPDDLEALVGVATDRFGPVDIVFNNAYANPAWLPAAEADQAGARGRPPDKGVLDYSADDWQACFDVNVLAPYRLAQLVVPGMRERGRGVIINVLTVAAFRPAPPVVAYGVSKAGLEMLTRYLAKTCGPEVRVNAICPGSITVDGESWQVFEPMVAKIPVGRVGRATDVVGAALFLASDASSYVTGQVVFVDGGRANTVG
jgi:NAD(P)-dependent dehydrogenase (short-subunit alcohol dehydrogenase family)